MGVRVLYTEGGGLLPSCQEICGHLPLAFYFDSSPALELIRVLGDGGVNVLGYLRIWLGYI